MAIRYEPPGTSIQERISPSVSTNLSVLENAAIIGLAQGFELETQQITLPSGTASFQVTVLVSGETFQLYSPSQYFVSVTNAVNPTIGQAPNQAGYVQGVGSANDFTAVLSENGQTITVTPNAGGQMAEGGIVNFTYQVNDQAYYEAALFTSQAAVEKQYGPAFSAGGIQTPISAGTYFAFEGGAQRVIAQPLFTLSNPLNPLSKREAPNAFQAISSTTWAQTLYALRAVPNVDLVCPIIGQSMANANDASVLAVLETVQDYIQFMQNEESTYIVGVFGEDSSSNSTQATDETLRSHAVTLYSRYGSAVAENIVMLVPSNFQRPLPTTSNVVLNAGGQYVAATLTGLIAGGAVNSPLTHAVVPGWQNIPTYRDTITKNADAQAGLLVLENNSANAGTIQVRHAITLDTSAVDRRALNVVRSKFYMLSSLINVMNTQIIGRIVADGNAPMIVSMAVTGVLGSLKTSGVIVDYTGLQVQLQPGNPTTCQVTFSWLPAFPLDYIKIEFSLDLTGSQPVSVSVNT